jgi:hypothetical protein
MQGGGNDLVVSQRTVESHRRVPMDRAGARTLPEPVRLVMATPSPLLARGVKAERLTSKMLLI